MIPLVLKLRREQHKEIAKAQDIIVEELYRQFSTATLHGGTAIWRCYAGNRFSEDVDAYIPKSREKLTALFTGLERKGFVIRKKKIGENSVFSTMLFNRIETRLEATFQKIPGILREYEAADANFLTVYTLSPESLLTEKVNAYLKRQKVRDLYDVFFLLRHVTEPEKVAKSLTHFLGQYKKPVDSQDLKVLIIEGIVPTPVKMLEYIMQWVERWEKRSISSK